VTAPLWFVMWRCHCSWIAERREDLPGRCPQCDTDLMGSPEAEPGTPTVVLGYEPHDMCGCWQHAGGAR
jgi:hypothetical protein